MCHLQGGSLGICSVHVKLSFFLLASLGYFYGVPVETDNIFLSLAIVLRYSSFRKRLCRLCRGSDGRCLTRNSRGLCLRVYLSLHQSLVIVAGQMLTLTMGSNDEVSQRYRFFGQAYAAVLRVYNDARSRRNNRREIQSYGTGDIWALGGQEESVGMSISFWKVAEVEIRWNHRRLEMLAPKNNRKLEELSWHLVVIQSESERCLSSRDFRHLTKSETQDWHKSLSTRKTRKIENLKFEKNFSFFVDRKMTHSMTSNDNQQNSAKMYQHRIVLCFEIQKWTRNKKEKHFHFFFRVNWLMLKFW